MSKLFNGDSMYIIDKIENNSISIIITDPPYFLDKMDDKWDNKKVHNKKNQNVIKSLPSGMKFNKKKGYDFQEWYKKISEKLYNKLKPGGFFFSFSSPRLYHRMVCAVEDAGFLIKDMFLWIYTQNQPKAMSLNHFIDKMNINNKEKKEIKNKLNGWKTPQIKSCFEPIVMAQKPLEGTYLNNYLKYNIGLINTKIEIGENKFPANLITTEKLLDELDKFFLIKKPTKKEKGEFNNHKTVKPINICEYLILLTTKKNDIVLDPFAGSGTTLLAAKNLGRKYIGIEKEKDSCIISKKRLTENAKIFKTN